MTQLPVIQLYLMKKGTYNLSSGHIINFTHYTETHEKKDILFIIKTRIIWRHGKSSRGYIYPAELVNFQFS